MSPLLLQNSYEIIFPHHNDDFQLEIANRGLASTSKTPHDCIIVFTYSGDIEVSKLSLDMARQGIRLVRVNSDFLDASIIKGIDQQGNILVGNEKLFPRLTWIRHFFPQQPDEHTKRSIHQYTYDQLKSLATIIKFISSKTLNGKVENTSLLAQLATANTAGFRIPKGVITNSQK